jgi:hypothetical protein
MLAGRRFAPASQHAAGYADVERTRFAAAFQASASLRAIVNDRRMSASIQ